MWIFYEIEYYFDYEDGLYKKSEQPEIADSIFTNIKKLMQFLEFYYGSHNYVNKPGENKTIIITEDMMPTVNGKVAKLFKKQDPDSDDYTIGFVKKMSDYISY